MRGRGAHPVARDADGPDEPFVAGADRTVERAARRGGDAEIIEVAHGVQLDQVESLDVQTLQ